MNYRRSGLLPVGCGMAEQEPREGRASCNVAVAAGVRRVSRETPAVLHALAHIKGQRVSLLARPYVKYHHLLTADAMCCVSWCSAPARSCWRAAHTAMLRCCSTRLGRCMQRVIYPKECVIYPKERVSGFAGASPLAASLLLVGG